ncbi:MAG: hypothetical protein CR989_00970 [Flavobacteriales bacterium]|nr:MAG: hypothetical protein CR989_00970 [Flavobacteriales bacterium]
MKPLLPKSNSHLKDLIKGGGTHFLFYGVNVVLVYIIAIFITKEFGPSVYGRYAIIKSLIMVLIIFSTLGLNTLVIKLAADKSHYHLKHFKSNFLSKSYLIIFITTVILSVILYLSNGFLSENVFKDHHLEPYFEKLPLILLAAVFLNYNSNLFMGQKRVLLFAIISSFLTNAIFILFLFLATVYYKAAMDSFVIICLSLAFVIPCIISFLFIFPIKQNNPILKLSGKQLINSGFPMMISSSMIYLIFSIDTIMLGIFSISKDVGIYRIVSQIAGVNAIFVVVLGTVVGPKIAALYAENNQKGFKELILQSSKLIFFISLPVLFILLIFSREILLYFGDEFTAGHSALVILIIGQFIFSITGFVDLILNMTDNQKIFGKITMGTALLNIVLNLILIPVWGINGAAVATGFSIVLTNVLALIYIKKNFNVWPIYVPLQKK